MSIPSRLRLPVATLCPFLHFLLIPCCDYFASSFPFCRAASEITQQTTSSTCVADPCRLASDLFSVRESAQHCWTLLLCDVFDSVLSKGDNKFVEVLLSCCCLAEISCDRVVKLYCRITSVFLFVAGVCFGPHFCADDFWGTSCLDDNNRSQTDLGSRKVFVPPSPASPTIGMSNSSASK